MTCIRMFVIAAIVLCEKIQETQLMIIRTVLKIMLH